MTMPRKGTLNRGRFDKFFEEKDGYVRYWGMCDITARDYQIFVPNEIFYGFLNCVNTRCYKNIKEILKDLDMDVQRFLLDGLSPNGWNELSEALESLGIKESLCYSGLGGIKKKMMRSSRN